MLSRVLRRRHTEVLVHTGQHYDDLMSDIFFRELDLPPPDVNLGVGSASHGVQTARMLEGLEDVLLAHKPDLAIVFGDTNSTLAGALAASKLGIPVAHVEAGFRSFNRSMPEEINRVVADHVSRYLFCPTDNAVRCLRREGIEAGVYHVGDLMYDSLLDILPRVRDLEESVLTRHHVARGRYYLATVHRPASTDDPTVLGRLFAAFGLLDAPVILPLHPRTRAALGRAAAPVAPGVHVCDPVGYLEMVALERNARAILSDSGGVRREAYFLAVPCVTLREDSEWPEALASDWDRLCGSDPDAIVAAARRAPPASPPPPLFGDGRAAEKIVEALERDPPDSRD